jgi:hypothetical protein
MLKSLDARREFKVVAFSLRFDDHDWSWRQESVVGVFALHLGLRDHVFRGPSEASEEFVDEV